MQLLVHLEVPPELGHDLDVSIDVEFDERVSTIGWLSAAAAGISEPSLLSAMSLVVRRTGQILDANATVGDSDVVSGDSLLLIPTTWLRDDGTSPVELPVKPVVTIDVLSGPDAGALIPLLPGRYVIGRGESATIRLADPKVLDHHVVLSVFPDGRIGLTPVIVPAPQFTKQERDARQKEYREQLKQRQRDFKLGLVADINVVAPDDEITVQPTTLVDGAPLVGDRLVDLDELIVVAETAFTIQPGLVQAPRDRFGNVLHNRTPYHPVAVSKRELKALAQAPSRPEKQRFRVTIIVAPLMMAAFAVLVYGRPIMALLGIGSLVAAIWAWMDDRRHGKGKFRQDAKAWREKLASYVAEINQSLQSETSERLRSAPDAWECANRALYRQSRLWERDTSHHDVLQLRVGTGNVESRVVAKIGDGGEERLREQGEAQIAHFGICKGAPICLNLVETAIVGIEGESERSEQMAASLIVQAATLHSPEELVIAVVGEGGRQANLHWTKWLPHTRSVTSPIEGLHHASGPTAGRDLIGRVMRTASARIDQKQRARDKPLAPQILVVIHELANVDPVVLASFLDAAPSAGMSVIWIGANRSQLPHQCTATVSLGSSGTNGIVRFVDLERASLLVDAECMTHEHATQVALALAPIRDTSAAGAANSIPRSVPALQNLELRPPTAERVISHWKQTPPGTLAINLGQTSDGPFVFDLIEHGPHGLIAGTSGAGKSELLQSMVLALASRYEPNRLNFLFVDYKGGAAVQDFRELPHAVGFVTDLDQRLSLRALTSLRAELKRREHLLDGRAKDVVELERLFPDLTPPRLLIVIDEFATLVKEVPDFVSGVVDVAQRGRSLGIHLILATQRPTGAVNDNILANTNLRIALRVLDSSDSSSVIGSGEAAQIPTPLKGRGFARLGPSDLIAFQTAYSGAVYVPSSTGRQVGIGAFDFGRTIRFETLSLGASPGTSAEADEITELQAGVAAIVESGHKLGQDNQRKPWLDVLPEVLGLEAVVNATKAQDDFDPARCVVLGLEDHPADQTQPPMIIDLEDDSGMLIIGSGGSGKTTALINVAASLAMRCTPDAVWIYALDHGGRRLGVLSSLPHVGAVIASDELERTTRLISLLSDQVARRTRFIADAGFGTLSELNHSLGTSQRVPRIIVLIDNWQSLASTFEGLRLGMSPKRGDDWLDDLKQVVIDGRPVGVHLIIAGPSETGIATMLKGALGTTVQLRQSGDAQWGKLATQIAELQPGQGLRGDTEVQLGVVGGEPSALAMTEALETLGKQMSRSERSAPRVGVLPAQLAVADLQLKQIESTTLRVLFGASDTMVQPDGFDLANGHAVIAGPRRRGKSTALSSCVRALRASYGDRVKIVGLLSSEPSDTIDKILDGWACHDNATDAQTMLDQIAATATPSVVVIDDAEGVAPSLASQLDLMARSVKPGSPRLIVTCDTATFKSAFNRPAWITETIKSGQGVVLGPDAGDATLLGASSTWVTVRPGLSFGPGRGVLVRDGISVVFQVCGA